MIQQNSESSKLICVCPECKNQINLSAYPTLAPGMVIECNHCGMTLLVRDLKGGQVSTEIVDEGK